MNNKSEVLKKSLLGLLGIALVLYFEITEYFRYEESKYLGLKFLFQEVTGVVIIFIVFIKSIKLFITHKSLFNSIPLLIISLGTISICTINAQTVEIKYDEIIFNNGIYINSKTQKVLDGTYVMEDEMGLNYSKEQYSYGVPVGKWINTFKGDLIYSGIYLAEEEFKNELRFITKSKRVDLNLWKEGDYSTLTISLISPASLDNTIVNSVSELSKNAFTGKYEFKSISVETVDNKGRKITNH